MGRQADGVSVSRPNFNVCALAKVPTSPEIGAKPPPPLGPSSASPLRRGTSLAHLPGHAAWGCPVPSCSQQEMVDSPEPQPH